MINCQDFHSIFKRGAFYEGSIALRALEATAVTAAKSCLLDPFGSWLFLRYTFAYFPQKPNFVILSFSKCLLLLKKLHLTKLICNVEMVAAISFLKAKKQKSI